MMIAGVLGASLALLHPTLAVHFRSADTWANLATDLDILEWKPEGAARTEEHEARSRSNATGQCLKFMHIPKTGGTSMDSITLSYPKAERPFRSYMELVYDAAAKAEDAQGMTAGEIFDSSHSIVSHYGQWVKSHRQFYPQWATPHDSPSCQTHTPPFGGEARAFYSDGCTVFCVIRDPLQRFISTWKFDTFRVDHVLNEHDSQYKECSPAGFDSFVKRLQGEFKRDNYYAFGCHFTPQVQMVYGAKSKHASTQKFCHRLLRYEDHMEQAFDALMIEFGRDDVRLGHTKQFNSSWVGCDLEPEDIWQSSKNRIYKMYREDYDAFGYTRP